jgi:hypothetical protein
MTKESVVEVRKQAARVIELCRRVEAIEFPFYYPSKHKAELKRASLDLTRRMAEMRRTR